MLTAALKERKSSHNNMKENLHFKQSRLNCINNQKQKQIKEQMRSVIASIGVHVVAKTDDEIYVLSIIKIHG